MGLRESMGRGLAMGQRCCGAALTGICRGAAAVLGCPGFPRAHALILGVLVAMGPVLRGRGDPHSVLASPHNRLEARLTASAPAWTWLLIGSLLVASHPWLRPPWGHALRALARLAVGLGLSRAGHALGHALEAATGSCRQATPLGTLLLPLDDPARCRGAGHSWEGFGPAPQAFALVHCGLGLAEEAAALGRRLYGRGKMAAWGGSQEESKMAARYGMGEEAKMATRFKMAAGYGSEEESKMAARYGLEESKMATRFKMATRYGSEEESKMAARYGMGEEAKMATRFKMAAGYGSEEESKMATRFKMATGYGSEEESKMAARYGLEESKMAARYGMGDESKMAARFKMAGYGAEEESRSKMAAGYGYGEAKMASGYGYGETKMAAGSGWAWPRPLWRPEWAGPPRHGWGGHLESGRRSPYGGGHFLHPGGHFDGGHLDVGHFEGRHFGGGHFEHRGGHLEPPSTHFHRPGGHLDYPGRHFEHHGSHFEHHGSHFDHRGGHFEGVVGHFEGGHLGEAPPLALSVLYLLALALLLTWHLLLVATLTYRDTWARNAAGAALGWALWAATYRGWYRTAWSPGPPGWG